jgi:membrane-bound ClpP family serine protease
VGEIDALRPVAFARRETDWHMNEVLRFGRQAAAETGRRVRRRSGLAPGWLGWTAVIGYLALLGWGPGSTWAQTAAAPSVRLKVPLPITEKVDRQVRAGIEQAFKKWNDRPAAEPGQVVARPTVVLEFDTANNLNGRGSHFESCLGLARFLQRPEMNSVRVIAYIPPPTGLAGAGRDGSAPARSQLSGHALLVALACEQIWLDPAAGLLGVGPDSTEPELERSNYQFIAKRGVQWPESVVAALVGGHGGVVRVNRADGKAVITDRAGREQLNQAGQEIGSEEWLPPGAEADWTAAQLAGWGLVGQPIINRDDLIARLETDRLVDFVVGQQFEQWSVAQLRVDHLDQEFLAWATRSLNADRVLHQTNMLLLRIDTLGGYDLRAAGDLAMLVADLRQQGVRTVALLPNGAKGAETLLALACDEIVLAEERRFGGNVTLPLADEAAEAELLNVVRAVAEQKGRDWSLVAALALGNQQTFEYRHRQTGSIRLLSPEQYEDLVDRDEWQRGVEVSLAAGLTAEEAKRRRIVDHVVADVDQIEGLYSIEGYRTLQPTFSDRTVQRIAKFVSRPGISHLLLMFGFFMLMMELSSPGLGIPGFLAACCLGLFFWGNYLAGSAGAFEIILFVLGLSFVLIEIFVVPGFGLFGIGGGVMIMASLVLAGQNFIVPQNSQDLNQMAWSMTSVLGAMAGVFAALVFIRYYMDSVPVLNRLLLPPPTESAGALAVENSRFGHLLHRHGIALTPLIPAGKVRFGSEVVSVVTDGQAIDVGSEVRVYEVWDTLVKVEPIGTSEPAVTESK